LEALAQLSAGGAKGILTSRPNYFTEAEELQMFELLYRSLEHGRYVLGAEAKELLDREREVDELLEQFIDRYERILKDLTPAQTEALIARVLSSDEKGRNVVLNLLGRIFRSFEEDDDVALSGKPVIVSYLLDVVEGLKEVAGEETSDTLTEWQVYKLIIDQLMLRDFRRSPEINPHDRREFLRKLAIYLSKRDNPVVVEDDFRDMVSKEFRQELNRYPRDSQANRLEQLFSDLRGSATLTRGGVGTDFGWRFSHNSIREYLVAEALVSGLKEHRYVTEEVKISDAMRIFAGSMASEEREEISRILAREWRTSELLHGRGQLLELLWDGTVRLYLGASNPREACLTSITGAPPSLSEIVLSEIHVSEERTPSSFDSSDFARSRLSNVSFCGASLKYANFANATLESVSFENCDLENARFVGSFIVDCDFSGALFTGADFTGVDPGAFSILLNVDKPPGKKVLDGTSALGFLQLAGAKTDHLRPIHRLQHHSSFPIVDKILEKLGQQAQRQRRGLEQRGAAHLNVSVARRFVDHLLRSGLITTPKGRKDLVEVTERGREVFKKYSEEKEFSEELLSFFEDVD